MRQRGMDFGNGNFIVVDFAVGIGIQQFCELVIIAVEFDFGDGDTFIVDMNMLGFQVDPLLRRD